MPHLSDCKRQATDKAEKRPRAVAKPSKANPKAHSKTAPSNPPTVYDFVGIAG